MAILKKGKRALPIKKAVASEPKKIAKSVKTTAATRGATAERDEWGITAGTDQSIILEEMIKGGADKHAIIERCNERFAGQTTSGGKPKPVSTVVNQLIHAMTARGFTVESTWRFVPPADGKLKPAAPRKRAATPAPEKSKPGLSKSRPKLPVKKTAASATTKGHKKMPLLKRSKAS
jgi:hypothetical protein